MDIYKVIEDHVISQMTPVIDLTLIETVSTGRYKLHSCNTEWTTIGDTITIDSVDYLVVDFEINEFLIVTGPSLPVQLYFQLEAPTFEYGNHRKVAIERDKQKDKRTITPMIYMMLVRNNRVKDYDSAYSFDGDARFFFLGTYNEKKDDIDTHQQEVIEPMRAMAKYFREKWNEREDIFEQITECAEQDWMNFGSPQIWGNNPRIFDENLSGVENAFTILSTAEEDCCKQIISLSCLPATLSLDDDTIAAIASGDSYNITLEDIDGNPVVWVYDEPTKTLTIQLGECDPVTMTYNDVDITSSDSGTTKAITVVSESLDFVGTITEDTAGTLAVTVANATIVNQSPGATWTDTVYAEGTYILQEQPWTDSDGSAQSTPYDPATPIVCTPSIPAPVGGLYVPLSWTGANLVNYTFQVPSTAANTFNTIARAAGATSFDMNIFAQQIMSANENWVMEGDNIYIGTASYFIGFGLQSITGINFANIDFCFFVTTSGAILWYQSGVSQGQKATLTASNYWSWRLEYNGTTKNVGLYINNVLVHTAATGYATQSLVAKVCGRNGSQNIVNHMALRKIASPNRLLLAFGDSITANNPTAAFPGRNYVEKMIAFSNHAYFASPILATHGHTSANLISSQLPLASVYYSASYDSIVADVMIGINDLRTGVPVATTQANIQTIVTTLQTIGYYVRLHTIVRDWNTDWAGRYTLNADITSNVYGADQIVDHTNSPMETNEDYLETDRLHPQSNGTTQIALESYFGLLSIP